MSVSATVPTLANNLFLEAEGAEAMSDLTNALTQARINNPMSDKPCRPKRQASKESHPLATRRWRGCERQLSKYQAEVKDIHLVLACCYLGPLDEFGN